MNIKVCILVLIAATVVVIAAAGCVSNNNDLEVNTSDGVYKISSNMPIIEEKDMFVEARENGTWIFEFTPNGGGNRGSYSVGAPINKLSDIDVSITLPDGKVAYAKNFKIVEGENRVWYLQADHKGFDYIELAEADYLKHSNWDTVTFETGRLKDEGSYRVVLVGHSMQDAKQQDNKINNSILPTSSKAEKPKDKNSQEELRAMEPFIDPELKNLSITTSDPEIKIVRLELEDKRDYKESTDWIVNVLISNEGKNPFYVGDYLWPPDDISSQMMSMPSTLLESGDRKWFSISPQNRFRKGNFDFYHIPNLFVVSCETVMPEVSPEFKNFNGHITVEGLGSNNKPRSIDLHSVKYVVTNEAKGWRSIFLEVSTKEDSNQSVSISLLRKGIKASISAGNITKLEVPLSKEETPEELTDIHFPR